MTYDGPWQMNDSAKDNYYLYNSKELNIDHALNWSDYGARYYDPSIGRWGQVDPLAEAAPEWSPYVYTFNSPISHTDPTGMMGLSIATRIINEQTKEEFEINDGYDFNWIVSNAIFNRIKSNGEIPSDLKSEWNWEFWRQVWKGVVTSDGSASDEITAYLITDNLEGIAGSIQNKSPAGVLSIGSGKLKALKKLARYVLNGGNQSKTKIPGTKEGGKIFKNDGREGGQTLPKKDSKGNTIEYREYDINPAPQHGSTRGSERMVVGSDGKTYYTRDHYKTFTEFKH